MKPAEGCRPVLGRRYLNKDRPVTSGRYIPGPPREKIMARAITLPPLSGGSRQEVRAQLRRSIFAIVPDRSGSIFATWGGDPDDVIGAAGESLFMLQRRYGGGRGLVVPWGSTAPAELVVGPTDVKRHFKTLKQALRNRGSLGGNDLPAALRRTAEHLGSLAADEMPVIFVPTDGIEDVTAETHSAVAALPEGSVHLILIDPRGGCGPEMEANWRSVAFGSLTRVQDLSVRNLATTIAELYADALGLELGTATPTASTK